MTIQQHDKILDAQKQNELWIFYHELFAPVNENSPLAQSLDRRRFMSWMKSSRASKFLATDENGKLIGLAIISSDLRHDPLISIPYFKKHFPRRRIFHTPVIAVPRELAGKRISNSLIRTIMLGLPLDALAIFFHSEGTNPLIPRLIERSCAPRVKSQRLDSMGCVLLHMVS